MTAPGPRIGSGALLRAVRWMPAVALVCAAGCASPRGSARPEPGVSVPAALPSAAGVSIVAEPPAGARRVAALAARADARYEGAVAQAVRSAEGELRRQAAASGAAFVVVTGREVVQIEPEPLSGAVAGAFEDASRDRLRPGGAVTPQRPIYRVRLVGEAYAVEPSGG